MNQPKRIWPKSEQEMRNGIAHWIPPFTSRTPAPVFANGTEKLAADMQSRQTAPGGTSAAEKLSRSVVLMAEAVCSSKIEGVSTNIKNLCQAEAGLGSDIDTEKVAGNLAALRLADRHHGSITEEHMLAYHNEIMKDEPFAGRFRNLADGISGVAESYNPPADKLAGLISDWLSLSARTDMPAATKTALSHLQFESIHPFCDGNGRTGRVLMQRELREAGFGHLPVSCAYRAQLARYQETFKQYKYGDTEKAVEFHAKALLSASEALQSCEDRCETAVRRWLADMSEGKRKTATSRSAIGWVCENFVFTRQQIMEGLGISERTAYRLLAEMEDKDILERTKKRNYYLFGVAELAETAREAAETAMHARHANLPLMASVGVDAFPVTPTPYLI